MHVNDPPAEPRTATWRGLIGSFEVASLIETKSFSYRSTTPLIASLDRTEAASARSRSYDAIDAGNSAFFVPTSLVAPSLPGVGRSPGTSGVVVSTASGSAVSSGSFAEGT